MTAKRFKPFYNFLHLHAWNFKTPFFSFLIISVCMYNTIFSGGALKVVNLTFQQKHMKKYPK